jgi:hypothetical protein
MTNNVLTVIYMLYNITTTNEGKTMKFNITIENENEVSMTADRGQVVAWHACDEMEFSQIEFEEITIYPESKTLEYVSIEVNGELCSLKKIVDHMQDQFEKECGY